MIRRVDLGFEKSVLCLMWLCSRGQWLFNYTFMVLGRVTLRNLVPNAEGFSGFSANEVLLDAFVNGREKGKNWRRIDGLIFQVKENIQL